ncbi:MAG: hypothetical protein L0216_02030 [Planctomycetales bacterium]|nr:hypothetical protein [Planctomycetales bacterium]
MATAMACGLLGRREALLRAIRAETGRDAEEAEAFLARQRPSAQMLLVCRWERGGSEGLASALALLESFESAGCARVEFPVPNAAGSLVAEGLRKGRGLFSVTLPARFLAMRLDALPRALASWLDLAEQAGETTRGSRAVGETLAMGWVPGNG